MNLTRPSLVEHIAIYTKLKKSTEIKVRELQEQETKIQNELITMRQLNSMLDIWIEMCHDQIDKQEKSK